MRRSSTNWLGFAIVLCAAPIARAQSSSSSPPPADTTAGAAIDADVEAWLRHGIELRNTRHDDEALLEFRRAYERVRVPLTTAQLGLAEQAVGDWIPAELHVRTALEARSDAWVMRNRGALEQAYAVIEQHVGTLEVRGGPAGAHVRVDGEPMGTLPLAGALHVRAGNVLLEVNADGFYSVSRRVLVTPGVLAREPVNLMPVETHGETRASDAPPATPVVTTRRATGGEDGSRRPAAHGLLDATTVALGVVGVSSLVGSVVAFSFREVYAVSYEDRANGCLTTAPAASCPGLYDSHMAAFAAGLVTAVAGVGLVTAAVVRYVERRSRRAHAWVCAPGATQLSVNCGLVF